MLSQRRGEGGLVKWIRTVPGAASWRSSTEILTREGVWLTVRATRSHLDSDSSGQVRFVWSRWVVPKLGDACLTFLRGCRDTQCRVSLQSGLSCSCRAPPPSPTALHLSPVAFSPSPPPNPGDTRPPHAPCPEREAESSAPRPFLDCLSLEAPPAAPPHVASCSLGSASQCR